ncbi:MAG: glutamate-5-semialdehyde dehydrogenase [Planctomycetes bacterium]|nr:glutamate-5-semialdehyde dehydrogenase [Planctomycetota bacterium]
MNEEKGVELARSARAAALALMANGLGRRRAFFEELARLLCEAREDLMEANRRDLSAAAKQGLSPAMTDRLSLQGGRLEELARSVLAIADQPDPLGVSEGRVLASGIRLSKVRVGIGVVGFIFESRPGVVVDAACLCVKSGNAVMLKGGKEAAHSNLALESLIRAALLKSGLPVDLVVLLDSTDRASVGHLIRQPGLVDVVIPRGGKGLIKRVMEESRVPVIKHYEGNCHQYVHSDADLAMALEVVDNSKTQRPGVCNALESLLVHREIAGEFLPQLAARLIGKGVEIRACPESLPFMAGAVVAVEDDYGAEYLELILSVKVVGDLEEAISHINHFGSGHTDGILTRSLHSARAFSDGVDSAVVMINASTRFNDGGRFGLGAEIGISTDKLHARGPMGADSLTTYKYIACGDGQIL